MENNRSSRDFLKSFAAGAADGSFAALDLLPEDINNSIVEMDEIKDFDEEIKCDIVVCGAGTAGVTAAVAALEEGKKVVILQKEAAAESFGNCASAVIKSGSTERGIERWKTLCSAFNSWRSNPALLQAYVDNSDAAVDVLFKWGGLTKENEYKNADTGISVYQWAGSARYTGVWKSGTQSYDLGEETVEVKAPWFGPKPNNMGTLLRSMLDYAAEEFGDKLDVRVSTPVVRLIQKDGKVTGCVGKNAEGKYVKVSAKAVILATGAYENNESMVRRFCPDVESFDKKVCRRTGDGNILAILAGGVMEPVAHSRIMHDFDAGLMWDEPTFINVNMNGDRFIDESIEMTYISNPLRYQPGFKGENLDPNHAESGSKGWYCQIYDNDYMTYAVRGVPDVVMARYLKNEDPSLHVNVFTNLIDTFRADTLDELAKQLGIPAKNLKATVERYNKLAESGNDVDFGKKSEYLHKIETAPYWGIRRHIRCSAITAGVETDANSQVITPDGKPIPGLYAVGNLGGKFFGAPDYPFFQPGLSLGHAAATGYIAAKHAAKL